MTETDLPTWAHIDEHKHVFTTCPLRNCEFGWEWWEPPGEDDLKHGFDEMIRHMEDYHYIPGDLAEIWLERDE